MQAPPIDLKGVPDIHGPQHIVQRPQEPRRRALTSHASGNAAAHRHHDQQSNDAQGRAEHLREQAECHKVVVAEGSTYRLYGCTQEEDIHHQVHGHQNRSRQGRRVSDALQVETIGLNPIQDVHGPQDVCADELRPVGPTRVRWTDVMMRAQDVVNLNVQAPEQNKLH